MTVAWLKDCPEHHRRESEGKIRDAGRRMERNPFNDLPANDPRLLLGKSPVRIGPMRSFTSNSGQDGQVNARRLNGERRFVERQGDAFAVPATWAKRMCQRRGRAGET